MSQATEYLLCGMWGHPVSTLVWAIDILVALALYFYMKYKCLLFTHNAKMEDKNRNTRKN